MCYELFQFIESPVKYMYGTCYALTGGFAAITNTVVFLVFLQQKYRDVNSNKLLISLAFCDALIGYVTVGLFSWLVLVGDNSSEEICIYFMVGGSLAQICSCSSTATTSLISFDRHLIIKNVDQKKHLKRKTIVFLIVMAWVIPAIMFTLYPTFWFVPAIYAAMILLPVIPLVVFYVKIIQSAEESKRSVMRDITTDVQKMQMKRVHLRLTRKTIAIITCHLICTTPTYILFSLKTLSLYEVLDIFDTSMYSHLIMVTTIILSLNSCFNPVLYVKKDVEFKKSVINAFKCYRTIFAK